MEMEKKKFFDGMGIRFNPSFFNVMRELDNDGNIVVLDNYNAENKHCNEGVIRKDGKTGLQKLVSHQSNSTRWNFSGKSIVSFIDTNTGKECELYRAHTFIRDGVLEIPSVGAYLTEDTFKELSTVPGLLNFDKYIPGMCYQVDLSKVPLVSAKLADFEKVIDGLVEETILKKVVSALKAEEPPVSSTYTPDTRGISKGTVDITVPYCTYSVKYAPTEDEISSYKGRYKSSKEANSDLIKVRYLTRAREWALEQGLGDIVPWNYVKDYHREGGNQKLYKVDAPYKGTLLTVERVIGDQKITVDA